LLVGARGGVELLLIADRGCGGDDRTGSGEEDGRGGGEGEETTAGGGGEHGLCGGGGVVRMGECRPERGKSGHGEKKRVMRK